MQSEQTTRARNWLTKRNLRPTKQRLALAEFLVGDGKDRHVTAESLYQSVSQAQVPVSLATIYNTLRLFCDAGLLTEIMIEGNKSYFDTRTDQHPHYYWESDHCLTDAPADAVKFEDLPKVPENTEIARIDVVIRLRDK